jgi:hypothetical protein
MSCGRDLWAPGIQQSYRFLRRIPIDAQPPPWPLRNSDLVSFKCFPENFTLALRKEVRYLSTGFQRLNLRFRIYDLRGSGLIARSAD